MNWKNVGPLGRFSCMYMYIHVPWYVQIVLLDGSTEKIIRMNGYVYKNVVKIEGNDNYA